MIAKIPKLYTRIGTVVYYAVAPQYFTHDLQIIGGTGQQK
jgi:hypothetical protein